MAHESFEDSETAEILNRDYVCIKVDKEERPDVDSIYMNACMSLTGSGGWPLTIIMEYTGKPFFSGTYFPKTKKYGMPSFIEVLKTITGKWKTDKASILNSAEQITAHLHLKEQGGIKENKLSPNELCEKAAIYFKKAFDEKYGGFGRAPKFPSPHNLLFLMELFKVNGDAKLISMAQKTLEQMAKGGIFDHIGFGFSRYSTDDKWLAPHFEKMLYDNALLVMAYVKAYEITHNSDFKYVAEKTIFYIKCEMIDSGGGFYSAQDADSDGVEGKYYVFGPKEITGILGDEEGTRFNEAYDITNDGNFEGKSIPNRILANEIFDERFSGAFEKLRAYRKKRTLLHKDDKILTAWNALMISALADASTAFSNNSYLEMAERAYRFIELKLSSGDRLFASFREGRRSESGFIDDYAFLVYALLRLYRASLDEKYLDKAMTFTRKAIKNFFDCGRGGFYLYDSGQEQLILKPKESHDGAIPSGNSVMTANLAVLSLLTADREFEEVLDKQIKFMSSRAADFSGGHSFYLIGLLQKDFPDKKITVVLAREDEKQSVKARLAGNGWVIILDRETNEYKLKDGKTTFYVCDKNVCMPPVNEI